jgi:transcriptional regulator with XRE-family HTH domain
VNIGKRLRTLRECKHVSHEEIQKRTGLHCSYTSRVEGGRAVPTVKTLEKFARALELPLSELLYEGEKPFTLPNRKTLKDDSKPFAASGKDAKMMAKLRRLLAHTNAKNQGLLLHMAQKMARRNNLPNARVRISDVTNL